MHEAMVSHPLKLPKKKNKKIIKKNTAMNLKKRSVLEVLKVNTKITGRES